MKTLLPRSIALAISIVTITSVHSTPAKPEYPPQLPGGKDNRPLILRPSFLKPMGELDKGVKIAKEAPTVDFRYYPGQDYQGNPWSAWGDSLAVGDKYYSAIGDHLAPQGNAFVYEYDANTKKAEATARR